MLMPVIPHIYSSFFFVIRILQSRIYCEIVGFNHHKKQKEDNVLSLKISISYNSTKKVEEVKLNIGVCMSYFSVLHTLSE
jgi:hypothetical protein